MKKIRLDSRHYLLLFLGIILVGLFGIMVNYLGWMKEVKDDSSPLATADCLSVFYQTNDGLISLTNLEPISDLMGINTDPIVFTVKNKCYKKVSYQILLETKEESKELLDRVVIAINNEANHKLSFYETKPVFSSSFATSHLLKTDSLNEQEEKEFALRMWIPSDILDVNNLNYYGKINVQS